MDLISSPIPTFRRNWLRWVISAGLKDKNSLAVTVQPSDEYQKQSSWGRRLLIAGVVCFLLGGIFLISQYPDFIEIADPNKNNVANVGIGEQESVDLTKSCYVAWSENMSDDIEFIVYDSHGEVVNQSGCGYELEAMDEKGTEFNRIGSWRLAEGTYDIHAICDSEIDGSCSEGEVMLLDYDDALGEIFNDYEFWLSCLVCMMGIVLLPVGGILHKMASRGQLKNRRTMMVINQQTGKLQPYIVDGEGRSTRPQTPTGNYPDSTTGEAADGISDGVAEGTKKIPGGGLDGGMAGEPVDTEGLMTTDQIYLLMHGSEQDKVKVVESSFQQHTETLQVDSGVPDPFVDSQYRGTGFTSSPFTIPSAKSSAPGKAATGVIEGESGAATVSTSGGDEGNDPLGRNVSWKDWDEG